MDSNEIGWKTIPNTVKSRMVDLSLVHKLVPSRPLCRRCKVMNKAIRKRQKLTTYNQYVKLKTRTLRNVSDDDETDGSSNFTDDDYNTLYKSDLSLTNSKVHTFNKNVNSTYEEQFTTSESDNVYDTKNKTIATQKLNNKCCEVVNSNLHEVTNNKSNLNTADKNTTLRINQIGSQGVSDNKGNQNDLQVACANKYSGAPSFKENSSIEQSEALKDIKICAKEIDTELNVQENNIDKMISDVAKLSQTTYNSNKPVKNINPLINKVHRKSQPDKDYHYNIPNNHKMKQINQTVTAPLNDTNEMKNVNDIFANVRVCAFENHSGSSERDSNVVKMCENEGKNNIGFIDNQPLLVGSTNQPKDSGIEADTEEEFCINKIKNQKKEKRTLLEEQQNVQTLPAISNKKDNSIAQRGVSSNDNRRELQSIITSTEMNKKYKMSCDTPLSIHSTNSAEKLNDFHEKDIFKTQETQQDIEDNASSVTNKRVQQLRRLNLTIESESSDLSEDDTTCCNTENMRDNLLQRSRESPDISNSENENVKPNLTMLLIQHSKKMEKNKNPLKRSYKSRDILQSPTKCKKYIISTKSKKNKGEEPEQSLEFSESNDDFHKCIPGCSLEKDLNSMETIFQDISSNCIEKPTTGSKCMDISNQHSITKKCSLSPIQKLSCVKRSKSDQCDSIKLNHTKHSNGIRKEFDNENQSDENVVQILNKKELITRGRPCNLQELIDKNGLVHQTMTPSFTFKDLHEDDIFILDIPSMAFEKNLIGKKLVLTDKKLKLGKQKYKVEYKDIGTVSCVFGRRKSHKPCKTVNIKPTERIIAYQKIIKTSLLNPSNQYINSDNKIEDNRTSTKRNVMMDHNVPFKRGRYNIIE